MLSMTVSEKGVKPISERLNKKSKYFWLKLSSYKLSKESWERRERETQLLKKLHFDTPPQDVTF